MPFKHTDLSPLALEFPELPALIVYFICILERGFEAEATITPSQHSVALKGWLNRII